MKNPLLKVTVHQLENKQVIDLRSQDLFQKGHVRGALNLNPSNLVKYGKQFLGEEKELVFVLTEEDSRNIDSFMQGLTDAKIENVAGFLLDKDIPMEEQESTPTISVEEFMEVEGDYLLLDLRHPDEITRPAPEGNGINIPLEELVENVSQLDAGQPIYTLCGSGNRATAAASYLKNKGYQPIVIAGGMGAVEQYRNNNQ